MSEIPNNPVIITNKKRYLNVYLRDKDGELIKYKEKDFKPYFFVEDKEGKGESEYVGILGEKVKKVAVEDPKQVRKLRSEYAEKGLKTFEADIKYTIRYALDTFEAPFERTPLRYMFFDIEVLDSLDVINTPAPVIAISFYDNFLNKIYTLALSENETGEFESENGRVLLLDDEKELIKTFISSVERLDPDLLLAWNIDYDLNYLVNRAIKLGIDVTPLSREGSVWIDREKKIVRNIRGRAVVDFLDLTSKLIPDLKSYSLENVAKELGLEAQKIKRPAISEMSLWELIRYNRRDIEVLVALEKREEILSFWDEVRRFVGLAWNDFYIYSNEKPTRFSTKKMVDAYYLRLARKLGVVLPTQPENAESVEGELKGGYVIEPPVGIFEYVAVLDLKSMYPNIVRTYNVSYETLSEEGEILSPLQNVRFKKEPDGIMKVFATELFNLRMEYKKKIKETDNEELKKEYDLRQKAIKLLLNAGSYGVAGYEKFRLYKKEVASAITAYGRELLNFVVNKCVKNGYRVLYGDTDSAFVKLKAKDKESALEEALKLQEIINSSFDEFARKWNVDKHYHEIELNYIYRRIMFIGVKKRYAGYYINEDGEWKEGLVVKGMEIVRSETAEITREVFKRVIEMLLQEGRSVKEALEYVEEVKKKIERGEVPIEKLVFKVNFDPNKEYKNKNIPHLRGLRFAREAGLVDGEVSGKLVWLYIKHPKSKAIAVPENLLPQLERFLTRVKPDYKRNMERYFSNIERILNMLLRSSTSIDKFLKAKKK